jgi:hypothetical protein
MCRYHLFFLFALLMLSCNKNNEQQIDALSNTEEVAQTLLLDKEELHQLVNGLLESDSVGAYLIILQTRDVINWKNYRITDSGDTIIDNSIPPPAWEFSYNKDDFDYLVRQGYLDTTEANYMFEQIKPIITVTLDSALLVREGIDYEKLTSFFPDRNRAASFKKLEGETGAKGFVRLSTPLVTEDKSKALISMIGYCGRLCGGGALYLLEKVEGNWKIIYKGNTWIS